MGYNDFGDFYYAQGALGDAFKNYVRTRDYCTTATHIIHMCLNAILVSIEMGQFAHVTSYVSKAEQNKADLDPITIAKLQCAAGLAHLEAKRYKLAARKFLETAPELGNDYSEVIAAQDVATYGGLCALASFDRAELKAILTFIFYYYSTAKVIDNINFRNFLELVPEVRELIHDFYSSHYASCLDRLGNLKANLLLDIHLHDHVETLYTEIRNKALIQYTDPFVSVDLNMMANAFKTTVAGIQKELEALITDNQIQARIDSHNKILYARHADQRKATFQRVLQTGVEFDRDVRAMLLRANLMKHDYNFKASRKI
ncbi:putative proteasome component (PCI) domain, winged helix DNA-binding domain superfamily [Helianthus annuus]|nr:putative proteasome component (PCI) domain, winged helix DNA-binding domain superfamily [Helianthus annuus]KAJ0642076.1 putative proteasome component (PCI) domain, winged helix DNA-binding domain superfamily [Helianthus annuus]